MILFILGFFYRRLAARNAQKARTEHGGVGGEGGGISAGVGGERGYEMENRGRSYGGGYGGADGAWGMVGGGVAGHEEHDVRVPTPPPAYSAEGREK